MVYYRKYRPKTLAELDNKDVAVLIGKYLKQASPPHAFLFTGPKGTGKTSTARILAKCLNCLSGKEKRVACGNCDICEMIARGDSLDVLEIDAASNRGIDEIRALRETIKLSPTHMSYKIYIIDEVHMLTNEAFNALLKTLEEPPRHAVFVLATTEAQKIPETIASRCVQINFHKATAAEIQNSLSRIVTGEKIKVASEVLSEIALAADGSFRDAAKILEELVVEGGKISLELVKKKVGASDINQIDLFLKSLRTKNTKELLILIQLLSQEGKNLRQFFLDILHQLEKLLIESYSRDGEWSRQDLLKAVRILAGSFTDLKTTVIPTLPFELAVVEYCEEVEQTAPAPTIQASSKSATSTVTAGVITEKWSEILEALKKHNHSIVGILRSCQPLSLKDGILTIEAAYKFHAERLTDMKTRDIISQVVKEVLGKDIKVETVLKKR